MRLWWPIKRRLAEHAPIIRRHCIVSFDRGHCACAWVDVDVRGSTLTQMKASNSSQFPPSDTFLTWRIVSEKWRERDVGEFHHRNLFISITFDCKSWWTVKVPFDCMIIFIIIYLELSLACCWETCLTDIDDVDDGFFSRTLVFIKVF